MNVAFPQNEHAIQQQASDWNRKEANQKEHLASVDSRVFSADLCTHHHKYLPVRYGTVQHKRRGSENIGLNDEFPWMVLDRTCATMMHNPLIKIPLRPVPIAKVCMTSGKTVPLAV